MAPDRSKGISLEEVGRHNRKDDCWVIVNGKVIDVTQWMKRHPGGEIPLMTFAGRDASPEFNMIHPPGVIEKFIPESVLGPLLSSDGIAAGGRSPPPASTSSGPGKPYTAYEVSEHNKKHDCWIIIRGQVFDVTQWIKEHPGGEQAILNYAGKDATNDFNMIHPPSAFDVTARKYCVGHIVSTDTTLGGRRSIPPTPTRTRSLAKVANDKNLFAGGAPPVLANSLKGFTVEEVGRHNKKTDCWVIINNKVVDVTKWMRRHPGGEIPLLLFAGRDASPEFNMIHPPGVIERFIPDAVLGPLITADGQALGGRAPPTAPPPAGPGKPYTAYEVSEHNKKNDCWVIVRGCVLDVTKFIPNHPGGEVAIMNYAGKDATADFNVIHPPEVFEKTASKFIIGHIVSTDTTLDGRRSIAPTPTRTRSLAIIAKEKNLFSGGAPPSVANVTTGGLNAPLLSNPNVGVSGEQWWGDSRNTRGNFGVWGPSILSTLSTVYHLIVLFTMEVLSTIVFVKNWSTPHDKSGLTRAAVFLIVFSLIHSLGNLHVYAGPNAFNGYAYFLNHPVPWHTLFLPVELYLLAAGILHVTVATIRTVKFKKLAMLADANGRAQLSMAITGAILFVFLFIHIFTFRLVSVYPEYTFRTKWMYPFYCANDELDCSIATTKDLYKMEFQLFQQSFLTVLFYLFCVIVFALHMSEGFVKIVNSSEYIPRNHKGRPPENCLNDILISFQERARFLGMCFCYFIALLYFSYPVYCYLFPIEDWTEYDREHIEAWKDLVKPL